MIDSSLNRYYTTCFLPSALALKIRSCIGNVPVGLLSVSASEPAGLTEYGKENKSPRNVDKPYF